MDNTITGNTITNRKSEDKKTAVFGIYPNVPQAERGVDALVQANFANADISVLMPDSQGSRRHDNRCRHRRCRRWDARAARRHRRSGHSRSRAVHRGRSNHGRPGGTRRRRCSGWSGGSARRHGHP